MKTFIKILKDNNCYNAFIENIIDSDWESNVKNEDCALSYVYNRIRNYSRASALNDAFDWSGTPQDHEFWSDIHQALEKSYYE